MRNTRALRDRLCAIPGVTQSFSRPFFHEVALQLPRSAHDVVERLAREDNIVAGFEALGEEYPEFEKRVARLRQPENETDDDLDQFRCRASTCVELKIFFATAKRRRFFSVARETLARFDFSQILANRVKKGLAGATDEKFFSLVRRSSGVIFCVRLQVVRVDRNFLRHRCMMSKCRNIL